MYNLEMPRILYGNFDFEHQLTGAPPPSPGSRLARINAELSPALAALAEEGDRLLCPGAFDAVHLDHLADLGIPRPKLLSESDTLPAGAELVPWGWSEVALKLAATSNLVAQHPPLDAVKLANCRRFAQTIEADWNCGLDGAAVIGDLEELAAAVRCSVAYSPRWVLKARFGMSGRERHLGSGGQLDEQAANWAKKRLERDGVIVLEPWVQRIAEAGLQFEIPRQGAPQLLGITPQLCDEAGHYHGNRMTIPEGEIADWQPAVETARRLAEHLQKTGYFGPLGIDAMRYCAADGGERLRPLQDVNARYTMGRLALGFRRLLSSHEVGTWLHCSTKRAGGSWETLVDQIKNDLPSGCRVVPTSPLRIDGQPPHLVHLILAAPSENELAAAERVFIGARKNPAG